MTQQQSVNPRPIILRAWEIRGLIDRTVTQIWRPMKRQPESTGCLMNTPAGELWYVWPHEQEPGVYVDYFCTFPWGRVGDRVWARESMREDDDGVWYYAADNEIVGCDRADETAMITWAHHNERSHCPSIHMPRWASRITLEVLDVQPVRVREAMRGEGMYRIADFGSRWDADNPRHPYASNPMAWRLVVRRVEK